MVLGLMLARRREMVSRPSDKTRSAATAKPVQHRSHDQETGDDSEVHSHCQNLREELGCLKYSSSSLAAGLSFRRYRAVKDFFTDLKVDGGDTSDMGGA